MGRFRRMLDSEERRALQLRPEDGPGEMWDPGNSDSNHGVWFLSKKSEAGCPSADSASQRCIKDTGSPCSLPQSLIPGVTLLSSAAATAPGDPTTLKLRSRRHPGQQRGEGFLVRSSLCTGNKLSPRHLLQKLLLVRWPALGHSTHPYPRPRGTVRVGFWLFHHRTWNPGPE